jgi:hypothetical protein
MNITHKIFFTQNHYKTKNLPIPHINKNNPLHALLLPLFYKFITLS